MNGGCRLKPARDHRATGGPDTIAAVERHVLGGPAEVCFCNLRFCPNLLLRSSYSQESVLSASPPSHRFLVSAPALAGRRGGAARRRLAQLNGMLFEGRAA